MSGALKGIKVIAVDLWAAMPGATAILGDWGAEVIKIEDPRGGDSLRGLATTGMQQVETKVIPEFELMNRNKKSVTLDLRQEKGKEIIYKLVQKADVFACSFVDEVRKKFAIDYQTLSQLNPKIIYVSLTGYGERGPESWRPGYDVGAFWAMSGLMATMGEPNTPPVPQTAGLGDHITAVYIAGAIAAALVARERNGIGQEVSLNLYHSGVWTNSFNLQIALCSGKDTPRICRKTAANPLYIAYNTKDGKWIQFMMLQSDRYWPGFCRAIGRLDLEKDSRFSSFEARLKNNVALISILDEVLLTKMMDEWGKLFDQNGVLWGPVQTNAKVIADPQAWQNQFFVDIDHPVTGRITLITSPARFSQTPAAVRTAAPALGQHTEEVLLELGYNWDDIVLLKDQSVII